MQLSFVEALRKRSSGRAHTDQTALDENRARRGAKQWEPGAFAKQSQGAFIGGGCRCGRHEHIVELFEQRACAVFPGHLQSCDCGNRHRYCCDEQPPCEGRKSAWERSARNSKDDDLRTEQPRGSDSEVKEPPRQRGTRSRSHRWPWRIGMWLTMEGPTRTATPSPSARNTP